MERDLSEYEMNLSSGEVVYNEGDKGNCMYYIRKGKIKITIKRGKHEKVLSILTDGAFFGESALIDEKPRMASATAVEETELLVINKASFEANLNSNPVLSHILKTVIHRMHNIADLYYEREEKTEHSRF
ncbi:cyclic nucleotide-binding domain-containing protein [candidate division WOR-3 bacterium]|uniref:Cyclic nucleotide-binding domain-containing protein n=1 Tax=candidate division WOR-3 bacterium TaxID=2052148 RepID=A0A9D5K8D4_UNCW3|nr:cyclic nucleotide-binding domain-containing protein [candidate division WOR-3 bacterium]MBD3364323.1 cyclic nucleotide-binding domain-containing protein [candidate division WOR-3 bacterium]